MTENVLEKIYVKWFLILKVTGTIKCDQEREVAYYKLAGRDKGLTVTNSKQSFPSVN